MWIIVIAFCLSNDYDIIVVQWRIIHCLPFSLEVRHQLSEQLRCLDQRLESHHCMTLELLEFYQHRAEIEQEYSRSLERLVKQTRLRHKSEKQKYILTCNFVHLILTLCYWPVETDFKICKNLIRIDVSWEIKSHIWYYFTFDICTMSRLWYVVLLSKAWDLVGIFSFQDVAEYIRFNRFNEQESFCSQWNIFIYIYQRLCTDYGWSPENLQQGICPCFWWQ